mmetsp:Transcript_13477/g.43992  ORF Transcript_13477/g.43992 Transcript_13477/m.43992 type:complete len:210 (-) Transcript_13477:347-976(-)
MWSRLLRRRSGRSWLRCSPGANGHESCPEQRWMNGEHTGGICSPTASNAARAPSAGTHRGCLNSTWEAAASRPILHMFFTPTIHTDVHTDHSHLCSPAQVQIAALELEDVGKQAAGGLAAGAGSGAQTAAAGDGGAKASVRFRAGAIDAQAVQAQNGDAQAQDRGERHARLETCDTQAEHHAPAASQAETRLGSEGQRLSDGAAARTSA